MGVIFDNKLKFNKYIDKKLPLAKYAFNTLRRFQHFHPNTRFHLFKTFVIPILTFSGIPLLYNGHKSLKKVQIFQIKQIKMAHNINWDDFIKNTTLHKDLNFPSTTHSVYKTFYKLYTKLNEWGQHIFFHLTPNIRLEILYYNPPEHVI